METQARFGVISKRHWHRVGLHVWVSIACKYVDQQGVNFDGEKWHTIETEKRLP
jgi:hypothetical protein